MTFNRALLRLARRATAPRDGQTSGSVPSSLATSPDGEREVRAEPLNSYQAIVREQERQRRNRPCPICERRHRELEGKGFVCLPSFEDATDEQRVDTPLVGGQSHAERLLIDATECLNQSTATIQTIRAALAVCDSQHDRWGHGLCWDLAALDKIRAALDA